jgi:hypothetical protein
MLDKDKGSISMEDTVPGTVRLRGVLYEGFPEEIYTE